MKKLIIAAAIAVTALFASAPEATAGGFDIVVAGQGSNHGRHGHNHHQSSWNHGSHHDRCHNDYRYRRPHVVRTLEVDRHTDRYVSHYLSCGAPVYGYVTVVTYRKIYSNGHSTTYDQTFYS